MRSGRTRAGLLALVLVLGACAGDDDASSSSTVAPDAATTTGDSATATTAPFVVPPSAGLTSDDFCAGAEAVEGDDPVVASGTLIETSGIAVSRRDPDLIWAHNDSGSRPVLYAVGPDGADLGVAELDGASAFDWEDMALGPGPAGSTLYLADIGDNLLIRDELTIYRVPEPTGAADAAETFGDPLTDVEHLTVTYADGPHNAETLLADPLSGDLYLVTTERSGVPTGLYRVPAGQPDGARVEMERVGEVPIPPGGGVSGGAISPDGSVIALRTADDVLLWTRRPDQTVPEAFAATPCQAAVADEEQGEAIDFTADGRGYVTISEGVNPPIHTFVVGS